MIKQVPLHSSSYSTTAVRVAITGLEKLAALKKKRQFEDKKVLQNVINQLDGTESDTKDDINIDDREAAELIQRLGMDLDCEAVLVLGPAGSRPALYASLCLLFGGIPGNSAPGTTSFSLSTELKSQQMGGRKANMPSYSTVKWRYALPFPAVSLLCC